MNQISYSLHLSAKSHAITTDKKLQAVDKHNLRKYKSNEYDKNKITVIRGSDSIYRDVREFYDRFFGPYVDEYNQKQIERGHHERQISDYFKHVCESSSDNAEELIIQLGDSEFWADKTDNQKKLMVNIYESQLESLEKYAPDFNALSAVIHMDESSVHMHIVGVAIGRNYKTGMAVRSCKTKVFTRESLSLLQDKMRGDALAEMTKYPELFNNTEIKQKEKGRNIDIPKCYLSEYNRQSNEKKQEIEQQQLEISALKKDIEVLKSKLNALINDLGKLIKFEKMTKLYKRVYSEEFALETDNINRKKHERNGIAR